MYYHHKQSEKTKKSVELIRNIYESTKNKNIKNDNELETNSFQDETSEISIKTLDSIKEINSDYVAWLKIDGTAIDYPVLHGDSNEKYLNYGYFGEPNRYGVIFMDSSCELNSKNVLIHGHNTFYDNLMFSDLEKYLDKDFLLANNHISFNENDYKIITCFETSVNRELYDDYPYSMALFNDFGAWLNHNLAKGSTTIDFIPEQALTLSTCKDFNGNRIVLIAILEN